MSKSNTFQKLLRRRFESKKEWMLLPHMIAAAKEARAFIIGHLQDTAFGTQMSVVNGIITVANRHAVTGQVELFDGQAIGWEKIYMGWLLESRALIAQFTAVQAYKAPGYAGFGKRSFSLASRAEKYALSLASALVFGRKFEAERFATYLRALLTDDSIVSRDHWRYHGVGQFILQLVALAAHKSPEAFHSLGPESGPYMRIIESWGEPELLARAICDAADFHCQRIEDKSNKFFSEFRDAPYDFFPAEILAIYKVREELGLETPAVDHPLLQTPFSTPTGNYNDVNDEMLDFLEETI
jgi:hypothetical protein